MFKKIFTVRYLPRMAFLVISLLVIFSHHYVLTGWYSWGYLMAGKSFVAKIEMNNTIVDVYVEKGIKITSMELLPEIIRESYNGFPIFIKTHLMYYPYLKFPSPDRFSIIVVAEKTYQRFDRVYGSDSLAYYFSSIDQILLRSSDNRYDIGANEQTIKHEIFHHLVDITKLGKFFEEDAAEKFKFFILPKK